MAFHKKGPAFRRALTTTVAIFFSTTLLLLLLLPSTGITGNPYGKIGNPAASAQFFIPEEENNKNSSTKELKMSGDQNSLLFRGLIGSMISIEDAKVTGSTGQQINQGDYAVAGRWRMFVNESLVQRFVANLTVARTDGSEYYNIFIENIGRHSEFARSNSNNNTSSSQLTAQIYADSALPSIVVPVTVEIREDNNNNKVLRISDIGIDEREVEDDRQQAILRIIDGQSIYGIVEFQGPG
jgi:hypothetical protein